MSTVPLPPGTVLRHIVAVDPDPRNGWRWRLQLDCGHEVWVISMHQPRRTKEPCERCAGK